MTEPKDFPLPSGERFYYTANSGLAAGRGSEKVIMPIMIKGVQDKEHPVIKRGSR